MKCYIVGGIGTREEFRPKMVFTKKAEAKAYIEELNERVGKPHYAYHWGVIESKLKK